MKWLEHYSLYSIFHSTSKSRPCLSYHIISFLRFLFSATNVISILAKTSLDYCLCIKNSLYHLRRILGTCRKSLHELDGCLKSHSSLSSCTWSCRCKIHQTWPTASALSLSSSFRISINIAKLLDRATVSISQSS